MNADDVQARFKAAVSRPEDEIDLAECAFLIAAGHYRGLDVGAYQARIDTLAESVRARLRGTSEIPGVIRTINYHMVEVEGFRGNTESYTDPRNSFLNEVLDRRLGIPITLSLLYMEIGRRLGVETRGVSFPGHFLVRFGPDREVIVIDPFFGGIGLGEADLLTRMRQFVPDEKTARSELTRVLAGASRREIVARMLRNLKQNYEAAGELESALAAADRIVAVMPHDAAAVRDRGELYYRLEAMHAALADFRTYLQLCPDAPDAAAVGARVSALAAARPRLS